MLLLLFDLRLANTDYVTNFLQSNTYLHQPKLPVVVGPRPEVFAINKGPRPVSIHIKEGPEAGKHSHLINN